MRTRSVRVRLVSVGAAATLALAGCGGVGGGGDTEGGVSGSGTQEHGVNDINPVPRDELEPGGALRWPLDQIPDNFNRNQLDGTLLENAEVMDPLVPHAFTAEADGTVSLNEDYFTSIELTSEEPQVLTYTINPEAMWDDDIPITWVDLQAQWQALNGTDPDFLVAATTGYEDIASVEQGDDERQAVVTFERPFAEWRSLFANIYPAATNTDPDTFNEGWINQTPTTAGPFRTEEINTTAQTITLVPDENWWGDPPLLDQIIFRVVERDALADAMANNEIDFYAIGSDVNLFQRGQGIADAEIRQAVEPSYNHLTFNGGDGATLSDPALRRAIAQGIDRQVIADALIGRIVPDTEPLGNHLYVQGSVNYVDHSGDVAHDPQAAGDALEELGWVAPAEGRPRERDGESLTLRLVSTAGNPISERISQLVSAQLAEIGVGVDLIPAPTADFFTDFVTPGNFDAIGFGWSGSTYPVTATRNIYTSGGEQNYGNVSTPEIDAMYDEAIRELDDDARVELGQRIDQAIWEQLPQLPLYQSTGAYTVRSTVANLGASGFADVRYQDVGFVSE